MRQVECCVRAALVTSRFIDMFNESICGWPELGAKPLALGAVDVGRASAPLIAIVCESAAGVAGWALACCSLLGRGAGAWSLSPITSPGVGVILPARVTAACCAAAWVFIFGAAGAALGVAFWLG